MQRKLTPQWPTPSAIADVDNLDRLAARHVDGLSECQQKPGNLASYLDEIIADIQATQKSEQALIKTIDWFAWMASAYLDDNARHLDSIMGAINRITELLPAQKKNDLFRDNILPYLCGENAQNELNMRVYADRASRIFLHAGYTHYRDNDFEFKTAGRPDQFLLTLYKMTDTDNVPFVYDGSLFYRHGERTASMPQLFP